MKNRNPFSIGRNTKLIVILLLLVILGFSLYMTFFFAKSCSSRECFTDSLIRCERTQFRSVSSEAEWQYVIEGAKKDICNVYVRNMRIANPEAKSIEGKDMLCSLPKGLPISPEGDLDNCHGLLKEALQDILIEKLHVYIVQNIGKISEEFVQPLNSVESKI